MFKKLPRTGMRVRIGDLEGVVKVVTPYHMYVAAPEGFGGNVAMEVWDDGQVEVLEEDDVENKKAATEQEGNDMLWDRKDVTEGTRVQYCRPGRRNGWTGTVVHAPDFHHSSFEVRWDQAPPPNEITQYSGSALRRKGNPDGYIVPMSGAAQGDTETYIVAGEHGGKPVSQVGLESARAYARKRAQNSRSGQAYVVYKAAETFQREDPPVKHTVLEGT